MIRFKLVHPVRPTSTLNNLLLLITNLPSTLVQILNVTDLIWRINVKLRKLDKFIFSLSS